MKTILEALCEHDFECMKSGEDSLLVAINKKVYNVKNIPRGRFLVTWGEFAKFKYFRRADDVIVYFFILARLLPDWNGTVFGEIPCR